MAQIDEVTITSIVAVGGEEYQLTIAAGAYTNSFPYIASMGDTETVIAEALKNLVNADGDLPVTATSDLGVITLTANELGLAGSFTATSTGDVPFDVSPNTLPTAATFGKSSVTVLTGVITEPISTRIVTNTGTPGTWTQFGVNLKAADTTDFGIRGSSDICFPDDFNNDELFVGVDDGGGAYGDVYRVTSNFAYGLGVKADIASLDLVGPIGDTLLLAGSTDTADVFYSTSDGEMWDAASIMGKRPSGDGPTYVLMAEDFADSGVAWAATSFAECAVSYTIDGGVLWNQISLIATSITEINDVAFYPDYETSGKLFMATTDGNDTSLWRYDGNWERVAVSTVVTVVTIDDPATAIDLVQVSPNILSDDTVFFTNLLVSSSPAIYRSTDLGQSWGKALRCQPGTLNSWVVLDADTVLAGDTDTAKVYKTDRHGERTWVTIALPTTITGAVMSFAVFGDNVLCASDAGEVALSKDLGATWSQVGTTPFTSPAPGTFVAFDTGYAKNSIVYAACGTNIYRFEVGVSTAWADIGDVGTASGIATADGCLYVSDEVEAAAAAVVVPSTPATGGVLRSVDPTAPVPVFERVSTEFGLTTSATLKALQTTSGSNVLYALDGENPEVLRTYTDALVGPFALSSPGDEEAIGSTDRVTLEWVAVTDAMDYDVMLSSNEAFRAAYVVYNSTSDDNLLIVKEKPNETEGLSPGTEYWWKVRVTAPLNSKWSDVWSFGTAISTMSISTDFFAPALGAIDVPLRPAFAWEPVGGATGYKFQLADNNAFTDPPMVDEELTATVYQLATDLDYSTAYYWRVKAVSG